MITGLLGPLAGLTPLPRDPWWSQSAFLPHFVELASEIRTFLPADVQQPIVLRAGILIGADRMRDARADIGRHGEFSVIRSQPCPPAMRSSVTLNHILREHMEFMKELPLPDTGVAAPFRALLQFLVTLHHISFLQNPLKIMVSIR